MNDHGKEDHEQDHKRHPHRLTDRLLGERVARHFHQQAEHIHSTPGFRQRVMENLPSRQKTPTQNYFVGALVIAATLFFAIATSLYFAAPTLFPPQSQARYSIIQSVDVAQELARGGELLSIDPTEQRIVYQPASQTGVLYMANLHNPVKSNALAMRFARDMAWSPDGSALVATVLPDGVESPLLALVPAGEYMHPLGPKALAASWSPNEKARITYMTLVNNHTELWQTNEKGQESTKQAEMQSALIVQRMVWSPDGKKLALVISANGDTSPAVYNQPGREIYILNTQTQALQKIVDEDKHTTIGTINWSPDGRKFGYELINEQKMTTLQTIEVETPEKKSSITPQHNLHGWSWSPDSSMLVYSDGGELYINTPGQQSEPVQTKASLTLVSPFWLKNGTIVCMSITNGVGKLAMLSQQVKI